jgi:plasmid stabilization system protein ParE
MTPSLIVRPEAEAELAEAFSWYEQRIRGLGLAFLYCAEATNHAIQRSPKRFPIVHRTIRRALTKRFPYQILYVTGRKRIVILAVFHAKRDPKRWTART